MPIAPTCIKKHDPTSVEPKELRHQMEHLAENNVRRKTFPDEAHDLTKE